MLGLGDEHPVEGVPVDRRRAMQERMDIARDLHDVVAHNISVINVQANTALHLMDRQPERAREALTAMSPGVTRRLIAEFASRTRQARPVRGMGDLTGREREVLTLIAAGLSNEEIARQIYVSPSTVKTHAARAMMKLGARDRAQLVVFAYEAGLVRPGWSG